MGDWAAFNESVDGRLRSLRPVLSPCQSQHYDQAICEEVLANAQNSTWRAIHPETSHLMNWEIWEEKHESCIGEPNATQCSQGRVPMYSVAVQTVDHIQRTVLFARKNNIRLTIRNTGHDLAGRSSGPGSLQLFTGALKGISYADDFIPFASNGTVNRSRAAVTVGAGTHTGELYKAAAAGGYTVVAGHCSTVGVAGGFVHSGGMSIMSPMWGLGSDQVLEANLVTADGEYITANEVENSEIFWAIRGGGGGTFGVVTSMTLAAYPVIPVTITRIKAIFESADARYWKSVEQLIRILPGINNSRNAAKVYMFPVLPGHGSWIMVDVFDFDSMAARGLRSFQQHLEVGGVPYEITTDSYSSVSDFLAIPKGLNRAGIGMAAGSILVSADYMVRDEAPVEMAKVFSELQLGPGDILCIDVLGGGQVIANGGRVASALHPEWRSTMAVVTQALEFPSGPQWDERELVYQRLYKHQMPLLHSLEPERKAAYHAVGLQKEDNTALMYWGSNYPRLREIKRRWDPSDLFITRLGVGSEFWDDEGMCRLPKKQLIMRMLRLEWLNSIWPLLGVQLSS